MDLWIRSQDKEKLVRVDDVVLLNDHPYFIGTNIMQPDGSLLTLGAYTSKQKALKVINDIQKQMTLANSKEIYNMPSDMEVEIWN